MTAVDNVLRAFSATHVERLTGLTPVQLRNWDNAGFFKPEMAFENRRSPYSRVYSFKDVVGLRTISLLMKDYKIPLRELKKTAQILSQHSDKPWSDMVLYVVKKEVCFNDPTVGKPRGVTSGQYVENIPLKGIIEDVRERAAKLKERAPDQIGNIERHRFVAHNAWVVAGTRVPIAAIRSFHEAGYSDEAIIREYPLLTKKDVKAALIHIEKLTKAA